MDASPRCTCFSILMYASEMMLYIPKNNIGYSVCRLPVARVRTATIDQNYFFRTSGCIQNYFSGLARSPAAILRLFDLSTPLHTLYSLFLYMKIEKSMRFLLHQLTAVFCCLCSALQALRCCWRSLTAAMAPYRFDRAPPPPLPSNANIFTTAHRRAF